MKQEETYIQEEEFTTCPAHPSVMVEYFTDCPRCMDEEREAIIHQNGKLKNSKEKPRQLQIRAILKSTHPQIKTIMARRTRSRSGRT